MPQPLRRGSSSSPGKRYTRRKVKLGPPRVRPAASKRVTGKQSMARVFTRLPELTGDTPGQRAAQAGPRRRNLVKAGYTPGGPGESMANPKRKPDANTRVAKKVTGRANAITRGKGKKKGLRRRMSVAAE